MVSVLECILYKRNVITYSIARTVGFDMQMFSAAAHAERGACGAQDLGSATHYTQFLKLSIHFSHHLSLKVAIIVQAALRIRYFFPQGSWLIFKSEKMILIMIIT